MIPKGNLHGNGAKLADYLVKGEDGEKASLVQVRGFAADDIQTAFSTIQAISDSQTNCEKPFFHGYFRVAADENLTTEQWLQTADRMEKALGFEDQPRAIAMHHLEDGTAHMHVAWSRIDMEELKAIDPGLYVRKMMEVARDLEAEYGLRRLDTDRDPDRGGPSRRPEFEEARRLGIDLSEVRQVIRSAYEHSDNGKAFAAAISEQGYVLAQGDRRDFVVIDPEGGQHAISKRLVGETAQEIRAKLSDLNRDGLPTVDEARSAVTGRGFGRVAEAATGVEPAPENARPVDRETVRKEITAAWRETNDGVGFAARIDELGYALAKGDRRDFVVIDAAGGTHNLARLVEGAKTADIRARLSDIDRESLPTVREVLSAIEGRGGGQEARPEAAEAVELSDALVAGGSAPNAPGAAQAVEKPLSATAGDIRLAYALSQSGEGFAEGLEARGISLAVVSPEEAASSQRLAGFARQVGHFAPSYETGELVAVNGFGGVYRLDERTTGDSKEEVAGYLAGIDRDALMDVTATREVMREASRTSFTHDLALTRPLTTVEARIEAMQTSSDTAAAFVAGMQDARLYLSRATDADLAAIRKADFGPDGMDASALRIKAGELVAVSDYGAMYRLATPSLDDAAIEDAWLSGLEIKQDGLRSVMDVRGEALQLRAEEAAFWDQIREDRAAATLERATVATVDREPSAEGLRESVAAAGEGVAKGIEKAFEIVAKPIEKLADVISDLFAPTKGAPAGPQTAEPEALPVLSPIEERRQRYMANAALDRIATNLREDRDVAPGDILSLTPTQIQGVKEGGAEYLMRLVQWHEDAKARENDYGRERER